MNVLTPPSGVFVVGAHGNPDGMVGPDGLNLPIDALAKMIGDNPSYSSGMQLVLFSCDTGMCPLSGGQAVGQRLATALGTNVWAPNDIGWLSIHTDMFGNKSTNYTVHPYLDPSSPATSPPDYSRTGNFVLFNPLRPGG